MRLSHRPREFHFDWSWDLPAPPEALWPLASDTDRFNRDTGLPPVEDARSPGEELRNARRKLRISLFGVTVEWEELPFEWVRPHRFGVVRRYARGPMEEMRVLAELTPLPGDRTRLDYRVAARPKNLLGWIAIPLQIGLISRITFGRVFRRYAEEVAERRGEGPEAAPSSELPAGGRHRRLGHVVERLTRDGVDDKVARALAGYVATADPLSASRIRPYVLADLWELPRRAVLEACLYATRRGYLDLRWDVLCPLCRGVEEESETLSELRLRGVHCDSCGIDFSGDFQQSVELTFRPNPSLRDLEEARFCVAGPQVTPHVVAQQLLGPGERRELRPSLEAGRHRIRTHGTPDGPAFRVVDAPADRTNKRTAETADGDPDTPGRLEAVLGPDGWSSPSDRLPLDGALAVENATASERLVVVERTPWGDTAVTAAEVTRLATFRDLFSGEVLRAGDFVEVGTLAVLFTDLEGSTALYRRMGDAPAFGTVMDHFGVLDRVVEGREGTRIKTIGDAVMAVFPAPELAVSAALEAHDLLARETGGEDGPRLVLKAGVHVGPCIGVTLNDRLDYFGSTVNVAARLGSMAGGGETVISDAVLNDPLVAELVARRRDAPRATEVRLRGMEDEPLRVWRLGGDGP